jgi:hypothetical protein
VYVFAGGWNGAHITQNTAGHGGGVYLYSYEGSLKDAIIDHNHATIDGGGLWTMDRTFAVHSARITANSSDGEGGGVFLGYNWGHRPRFDDCVIERNHARTGGGGMWSESTVISIETDWGMRRNDNDPNDLVLVYSAAGDAVTYDGLGADESFVCVLARGTCE